MAGLGKSLVRGALKIDFIKSEVERFGAKLVNKGMGKWEVQWPAEAKNIPGLAHVKPAPVKDPKDAVGIARGMAQDIAGAKKTDGAKEIY